MIAFHSTKTFRPIPTHNVETVDALTRLTLDPTIRAINYFEELVSAGARIRADAIFVQSSITYSLLEVLPSRQPSKLVTEFARAMGFRRLTLTDDALSLEPRRQNEREIWRHAEQPVPVHLRMQILATLNARGAPRMDELLTALEGFRSKREAVLALACAGSVTIDVAAAPIGPTTIVRLAD